MTKTSRPKHPRPKCPGPIRPMDKLSEHLPEYTSSFTLASSINMCFIEKIHKIKMEFPLLEACLPAYSFVDIDIIMPVCTAILTHFNTFL